MKLPVTARAYVGEDMGHYFYPVPNNLWWRVINPVFRGVSHRFFHQGVPAVYSVIITALRADNIRVEGIRHVPKHLYYLPKMIAKLLMIAHSELTMIIGQVIMKAEADLGTGS